MKVKRTANAGVLLELDGQSILLDGVCGAFEQYLPTPETVRQMLLSTHLDAVAFTHAHIDHYDAAFVSDYLQNAAGPVLGPADIPFTTQENVRVGQVQITQIPTRHIGKLETIDHRSFIVEGTQCVWFVGDASPLQWKNIVGLPKPDVLIAPYGYAICSGWQICAQLGARAVVILHLPDRAYDIHRLWDTVLATTQKECGPKLYIPAMDETLSL